MSKFKTHETTAKLSKYSVLPYFRHSVVSVTSLTFCFKLHYTR